MRMDSLLKWGLAAVFLIVAIQAGAYVYENINPWLGVAIVVLTLLGVLHFFDVINIKNLFMVSLIAFGVSSCNERVETYEVGVRMTNYGKNGVSDYQRVSGKVATWQWGTFLYKVPTAEQSGEVGAIELNLKDGTTGFSANPTYTYSAIKDSAIQIVHRYSQYSKAEDFFDRIEDNILDKRVINAYREAAWTYTADSLLNGFGGYEEHIESVLEPVFEESHFKLIEVTSNLNPPQSLSQSINQRNKEISDAKKEREEAIRKLQRADDEIALAIKEVEKARLEAQANIERAKGLTPQVLDEMKIKGWIENGCKVPQATNGNSWYDINKK